MQLSLPPHFPAFPEPASSPPVAADAKNEFDGTNSDESTGSSFENYLPKADARDSSSEEEDETDETDPEKVAAALSAWLWTPVPPTPVAPPVLPILPTSLSSVATQSDAEVEVETDPNAALASAGGEGRESNFSTRSAEGAFPAMLSSRQFTDRSLAAVPVSAGTTGQVQSVVGSDAPATPAPEITDLLEATQSGVSLLETIEPPPVAPAISETLAATVGESTAPAGRIENAVNPVAEPVRAKTAALDGSLPKPLKTAATSSLKHFLSTPDKGVSEASDSVGISVAKVSAVMSATSTAPRSGSDSLESIAAQTLAPDTVAAPVETFTLEAPTQVSSVRETIAAVAAAVDALETRGANQRSVELQFKVGDQPLGLRVELRNGTVHTLFRTESPELRQALAQEWNTSAPIAPTRDIRVADPVFSSSSSGQDSSFGSLGQESSQQRGETAANLPRLASFARGSSIASTSTAAATTSTSSVNPASQLLHAFA